MSWKNVKEFFNEFSFKNSVGCKSVTIETALEGIEIAEKLKWNYLEKNKFPKEKQRVLCVFKETNMVQEDIFFKENVEYFKNLYIAWRELPVFNKA